METAITRIDRAEIAEYTQEQRNLIRQTCFPDSTDNELAMYLHVAKTSGLDPLRKQLHAIKTGGRVSFIADINGLQARAAREPDYRGLEHAVVYEGDEFLFDHAAQKVVKHITNPFGQKKLIGAWAMVYREGLRPFVSLVRFDEYNNARNPLWKDKPSVMLDKVAKSSALRLAYPEALGGIYERSELDKAPPEEAKSIDAVQEATKRMLAAGAGKAKERPAPMRIVDVAPDQTEEEALAKQDGPKVTIGSKAGMLLTDVSTDDLTELLRKAHEYLEKTPNGKYAADMPAEIEKFETELTKRLETDIG